MTAPRVLSIAGTDPSGGAGIQADLKSIGALGGYGMAAVTALVAQNTRGVASVHVPPPEFLRAQLDAVSDDVVVDAVKLGMLHSAPLIEVVGAWLARVRPPIVVLDPVMVATSGDRLLEPAAEDAIRALCAHVHLVTPNIPELAVLASETRARTWEDAVGQAQRFAATTETTVLLKGGHLGGEDCPDALVTADSVLEVTGRRLPGGNTHGTGCSLSAAMATLAASGWSWADALARAKQWLAGAISHGPALEVGQGNGPVDHFHELRPTLPEASWTDGVWADGAALRAEIRTCSFVTALGAGDLDSEAFRWYLAQDAFYLSEYSRVFARASALAPTGEEQVFWARSAADAIAEEARLHREHIGDDLPAPAPATTAYVQHLHASCATGSYAEIVAALLPCYWVYADLGEQLQAQNHPHHPYRDWLDTYAAPGFAEATRTAREIVDRAARDASLSQRTRMRAAFETALRHELAFFDAPVTPSPYEALAGERPLLQAPATT